MWQGVLIVLIFGVAIKIVLDQRDLNSSQTDLNQLPAHEEFVSPAPIISSPPRSVRRAWLHHKSKNPNVFESIEKILVKLGLETIEIDASSNETLHYDWDFLWSFENPDVHLKLLNYSNFEFYQKVNHIPGNFLLTSKSILSTVSRSKFIPRGFMDKDELKSFAEKNPKARFVQKLKGNRGVALKNSSQIDFSVDKKFNEQYFAQVFVEDPFLLDGHKFDFNIYVVITSVDPLRVYYYAKNIYVRVCKLPYNPNDFSELDSYVISDSFIPGFEFPVIKHYFERGYTYKDAFDMYLKDRGEDPQKIYNQVEDCIQSTIHVHESKFKEYIANSKAKYGKHHFFEMYRFDFLIDAKLKLHLMEINLSPNLHAGPKIRHNRHIMESAIYNYLNLVGVGSYLKNKRIRMFEPDDEDFLVHDNSISVQPEVCMSEKCMNSPDENCQLCVPTMNADLKFDLKMAYLEHMNLGDMKRVIPPKNVNFGSMKFFQILSKQFLVSGNSFSWRFILEKIVAFQQIVHKMVRRDVQEESQFLLTLIIGSIWLLALK